MSYKILIVGGGTAGWASALYARYKMPSAEITLVESEAIGILGAGEGTTPAFIEFLEKLDIPLARLIQETSTTLKNGIKFTNWTGPDSSYYHGFYAVDDVSLGSFNNSQFMAGTSFLAGYNIAKGKDFSEVNYTHAISESNKVPLQVAEDYNGEIIPDPIAKYFFTAYYANHFDAVALADFFKRIAVEERNITRVEGKVVNQKQSENGDLKSVLLESGEELSADFFIDCTGFAKRLVGKLYKAEWVSHKEHLTVNSALPFFLPIDEEAIPAYTESTAMKYGWMWKIPLQHRYGCGYVFDSNYITQEQAREEILELVGDQEIVWPREEAFRFEPGYFKTSWVNNCLAVGLSSGFIEPLEATSIWASLLYLEHAFLDLNGLINRPQSYVDEFNAKAAKINQDIFEFVYFHYMGGRTDTPFWEHYQDVDRAPKRVQDILQKWSERVPSYWDHKDDLFAMESWIAVASGLNKIDKKVYKKTYDLCEVTEIIDNDYELFLHVKEATVDNCTLHVDFLRDLKKNYVPAKQII